MGKMVPRLFRLGIVQQFSTSITTIQVTSPLSDFSLICYWPELAKALPPSQGLYVELLHGSRETMEMS